MADTEIQAGDVVRLRDGRLGRVHDAIGRALWLELAQDGAFRYEPPGERVDIAAVVELARRGFRRGDAVLTPQGDTGRVDSIVSVVVRGQLQRSYRVLTWNPGLGRWAAHARGFPLLALAPAPPERAAELPRPPQRHVDMGIGDLVTLGDGRKGYVVIHGDPMRVVFEAGGYYFGPAVRARRADVVARDRWPADAPVRLADGHFGRLSGEIPSHRPWPVDSRYAVVYRVRVWSPDDGAFATDPVEVTDARVLEPGDAVEIPTYRAAEQHRLEREATQKRQEAPRQAKQREAPTRPSSRGRSGLGPPTGPPPSFWRGVEALFRAPDGPLPLPNGDRHGRVTAAPEAPAGPAAPMPPGSMADAFERVTFGKPFRRYQAMALDAFERARSEERRRVYLVMPPGSGKTAVGLEIARRLGNRTLALGPNTAIQAQWLTQWREFEPQHIASGDSTEMETPITALTYQSICNLESHSADLDDIALQAWHAARSGTAEPGAPATPHDEADLKYLRHRGRVLLAQGGDHERLLALLHPNGRGLIERIRSGGSWTIVLDECHHLLEMWGYLVRAIVQELGDRVFLVGLTATQPAEMEPRERALYQELFGRADLEVPTPALVKEGNLAPYRDLAFVTTPLAGEADYIRSEEIRFMELVAELMDPDLGTVSFVEWLHRRAVDRESPDGARVEWSRLEHDSPDLARAVVRFHHANGMELPPGARLREANRQPLTADDWVVMIDDYAMGHLRLSGDPLDLEAWDRIHGALPSVGYVLTRTGVRSYVSTVDRVLLLSASKAVAALEILAAEERAMGPRLRALLLCDFETASAELAPQLRGVLDRRAGSAVQLLQILLTQPPGPELNPVLVTGRTVACSRSTAMDLCSWLEAQLPELGGSLTASPLLDGDLDDVVRIEPERRGWAPSRYLPLVTRFFEDGRSRCLIGTRGLLGEGWDARSVDVLIDLTGVTTRTSVHQMRGRSLRLDPSMPRKVAHNWDVICVAPEHPKGLADYARFVRKHSAYYSITATGEIESGVSHVDPALSPYSPPPVAEVPALNARMIELADDREEVYERWGVGLPYRNVPVETVRVRFGHAFGLPAQRWLQPVAGEAPPRVGPVLVAAAALGVTLPAIAVAGLGLVGLIAGLAAGLAAAAGAAYWAGRTLRSHLARMGPSGTLTDIASALAEAMSAAGIVDPGLGAAAVRLRPQADGYYRAYLEGAAQAESRLFSEALDELLSPFDEPRYIVPRYIPDPPRSAWAALSRTVRQAAGERLEGGVVYHAVPTTLAGSGERVAMFGQAWNRYVSAGTPLSNQDAEGQAVIEVQRGEDPFAVTSQMRTLWI